MSELRDKLYSKIKLNDKRRFLFHKFQFSELEAKLNESNTMSLQLMNRITDLENQLANTKQELALVSAPTKQGMSN